MASGSYAGRRRLHLSSREACPAAGRAQRVSRLVEMEGAPRRHAVDAGVAGGAEAAEVVMEVADAVEAEAAAEGVDVEGVGAVRVASAEGAAASGATAESELYFTTAWHAPPSA